MIYLPAQQQTSSEEQKLVKLFQNVDLRCNFYFSYDFDLSRTFQSNWLTGAMSSVSTDGVAASEVGSKRAGMTVSDKFIWNWRMTEALRERDDVSADWLFYIVHGYFGQAGTCSLIQYLLPMLKPTWTLKHVVCSTCCIVLHQLNDTNSRKC